MTCHLFGDSVYSWPPATVNYVFTVLVYRLLGLYFILLKKWKHCPRYWPFVWGIHRSPVKSLHKGPATRKMFPFDDVIMQLAVSMCTVFPTICTHGLVVFCFGVVIGFNQVPLFLSYFTGIVRILWLSSEREVPPKLWYKSHLIRQYICWSLRCSWSVACRVLY